MTIITSRRSLITGLVSLAVTAPAIVRAASLMPVRSLDDYPMDMDSVFERLAMRSNLRYIQLLKIQRGIPIAL